MPDSLLNYSGIACPPTSAGDIDDAMSLIDQLSRSPDRLGVLTEHLTKMGMVPYRQKYYYGCNLILARGQPKLILIAHHDRAGDYPAANDNAASLAALIYGFKGSVGEVAVCLTDHEEAMVGSINWMGSWYLGESIRSAANTILVFDVCGIGDTVILSMGEQFTDRLVGRVVRAADTIGVSVYNLPTPPSDNLCFEEVGLISVLPQDEVVGRRTTWARLHTFNDNYESIIPSTVGMMIRLVRQLIDGEPTQALTPLKRGRSYLSLSPRPL